MNSFGIAFLVILSLFVVVEIVQLVRAIVNKYKQKKENNDKECDCVVDNDSSRDY